MPRVKNCTEYEEEGMIVRERWNNGSERDCCIITEIIWHNFPSLLNV